MKKICQRLLALLCTLALALTAVPAVAKADSPASAFTYKSVDGKTIVITGYKGSDSTLVIPDTIDNKPVTTIGAAAFRGNTTITEVQMVNVQTIKESAFSGCSNLTTVWSYHITTIGESAFEDCTRLKMFPLTEKCSSIGADAFINCYSMTTMEIPASVTTLGNHCVGFLRTGTTYTLNPSFSIKCTTGSTAYNYAKTNKITCSSDTCTHNMVKIPAVAPTATTEGNNEYYHCTICNKFFKDAEGKQETTVAAETLPKISANNLNDSNITVSKISDQLYTGKAITPTVTVKAGLLTTLKLNQDYVVTYANNIEVGTATVTITGIGSYTGTRIETFTITSNAISITAKDYYFNYSSKERTFKITATASPTATITFATQSDGISITKKGSLTMEAGFSGTATITITAKKTGYQTSTKQISVFVPQAIKLTDAIRSGATSATINFEGNINAHGYKIQYSTSQKFTLTPKEVLVANNLTTSVIKGLERGQIYYVRICSYMENNGQEYCSKWSATKTIDGTVPPTLLYERYLRKQATKVQKIIAYTYADLNNDGVDELLYKYYNGGKRNCGKICTIVDGKVKVLKNQKDGSPNFYRNAKNELMMDSSNSSKEKSYRTYQFKNGKLVLVHTYRSVVGTDGKTTYTLDGKTITKADFTKMKTDFKKLKTTKFEI